MKQFFAALLCLLALSCSAVPVVVQAHGSSHAVSEDEAAATSSGRAVAVMTDTRVEYIPALRVWYDRAGTLMVCRYPGEPGADGSKRCEISGNKNVQAGWVGLPSLLLPGYALSAVQVNETKSGPSLVLYWRASPVVPAKKP